MTSDLARQLAGLTDQQRRALAQRLRARDGEQAASGGPAVLSHAQERLWFLDQLDPGDSAYNIPLAIRLSGPLDPQALHDALLGLTDRHEALRTVLVDTHDGPRQVLREPDRSPLPVTDLRSAPDPGAEARHIASGLALHRFDLTAGPLVTGRLLRVADEEHLLVVVVHHIVFDGWSAEVFVADLARLYGQAAGGGETGLAPITRQFRQYAIDERRELTDQVLEQRLSYWRHLLADAPELSTVPPDLPRPHEPGRRSGRRLVALAPGLGRELAELARSTGATMNAVLLAAMAAVVRRLGGGSDVLLGTPVAGRTKVDLEPVIGCFANTLVVRIEVDERLPVRDLVRRAHGSLSQAYAHQAVPYARVVEAVSPARDSGRNPLFQVMVNLGETGAGDQLPAAGVEFGTVDLDSGQTDFDIFLNLQHRAGEVTGTLDYRTDLFLEDTVDDLVRTLGDMLAQFARQPADVLAQVPVFQRHTAVLASSFTADPVQDPLRFWTQFLHAPVDVELAPYGQLIQQLLAPRPAEVTIGCLRWEDWLRHRPEQPAEELLDQVRADLADAVMAFSGAANAQLLLVLCPSASQDLAVTLARQDDLLVRQLRGIPGVHVAHAGDWAAPADVASMFDEGADLAGHVPYTPEFFAAIGGGCAWWLMRLLGYAWPGAGTARGDYLRAALGTGSAVCARIMPRRRPGPAAGHDPGGDAPVVPRTDTERALLGLWQEALGADGLGVTSDFFGWGGHSLLATRLVSRIRAELGADVSMHRFLTSPTVQALARVIDGGTVSSDGPGPVLPARPGGQRPLSFTQRRMWALAQLADDSAAHHTAYAARLAGPLDEEALRGALSLVIARHEVLRTSFSAGAGGPAAIVRDQVDPWLPAADMRTAGQGGEHGQDDPAGREQAVLDLISADLRQPYDLAAGPLIRARLIRESADVHTLMIGMHHAVCDIASWQIFLAELSAYYSALTAGQAPRPAALAVQFADYAAWQQDWLASEVAQRQIELWRARLSGAPPVLDLRCASPRPARRAGHARSVAHALPAALGRELRAFAQSEGVSPVTVLLAALALTLRADSGQDDLVVGLPIRGRSQPELEPMIGYFADLLPLRIDASGTPALRPLVQRVRASMLDAAASQDIPLSAIVDAVRPARSPSHHPLFQHVVNYVEEDEPEPVLPGLRAERLEVSELGTDFDLFLTITSQADEYLIDAAYATDILDDTGMRGLIGAFETALKAGLERPDARVAVGSAGGGPEPGADVAVASSFPSGDVLATARTWAAAHGVKLRLALCPPGSVFRQLLDPHSALSQAPARRIALLMRWEDLIGARIVPERDGLAAAVWHADEALGDLLAAVREFSDRSQADLLVLVCPPAAPWEPLAAVFDGLGGRLARDAASIPGVSVILPGRWADFGEAGRSASEASRAAAPGRLLARRILHGLGYSPRWVAVDPAGWPDFELGRLVAGQLAYGRQVVLAGAPRRACDGTVLAGARQLGTTLAAGLPGLIEAGQLAATGGLVLASGPGAAAIRQAVAPGAVAVLEGGAADRDSWLLDPPWGMPEPRPWTELDHAQAGGGDAGPASTAALATDGPATDLERLLAGIWASLLLVESVGAADNFFDLGGDSMLAIEAAFRAAEAGLAVTPRLIVANPSVRALATAITAAGPASWPAERALATAPLSPAQRWYLDAVAPGSSRPERFNHPYYLYLNGRCETAVVRQALDELASAHDSLRVRVHRDDTGRWWQDCAPQEEGMTCQFIDFSAVPDGEREAAITRAAAAAQSSLSLGGPLVRAMHLRPGGDHADRLLLIAHHLATDGVSRGILLDDLRRLLQDIPRGRPFLPRSSMPYLRWSQAVHEYAQSAKLREQLPFWLAQRAPEHVTIPHDRPGPFTFGTLVQCGFALTEGETARLLDLARRLSLKMNDLLVWTVAGCVADWTGQPSCALALTSHARDALHEGMDTSRTTGWFQVFYPVLLTVPQNRRDPASAAQIARQLAAVPGTGIGWGALRYLCEDASVREQLAPVTLPRVSFNYTGHFSFRQISMGADTFSICAEPYGLEQEPDAVAPFDLDFMASMAGSQLHIDINYSPRCHTRETADQVLADLHERLLNATRNGSQSPRQGSVSFE